MKDVLRTIPFRGLCILMLLCAFTVAGFAQSTTYGAIGGTVTDPTKAVIPNASVTVVNAGTSETKTGTTDSFGHFRVVNLNPGTYIVTVEAPSFSSSKTSGVVVEVGRITELEVGLTAGSKEQTVEVTSEAPTVNTFQQDFANNIDQTTINNLPINGRRWSNFALLSPGATPDGNFGLISFRGISGLLNNNTVDGGDNNQAFFSEERGRTRASYTVSQNSIREFQVNTSNYSAEYGRAAGGVVNSVTKSGTNNIHGEAFYYIRDNTFGATNPFTTRLVKDSAGAYTTERFKPEDRRHQFGGNLGGALIKDRLFYFFNYDGQRRNFPGVGQASNPTAFFAPITVADPGRACRDPQGKFVSGLNDGQYLWCQGITQAQANEGLAFLAAETGTVARTGDQDIFFPKLDWKVNDNHTVTLSYNRMRWNSPAGVQTQPTVSYAVNSFGNDGVKTDMFIARVTSTLSTTMTNEFRYQWGRDFEFQSSQPMSDAEAQYNLGTAYGNRPPYITVTNGMNMGRANFLERTAYPDEKRNQFSDTMSIAKGHHFFKFGFDFNRNYDLLDNLYQGGGQYSYSGTYARASFITDLMNYKNGHPSANYSSFTQAFGPTSIQFKTWDHAIFFQDDWKVLPRLTVNVGIRYEYEMLPKTQYANADFRETQVFNKDKNNFGPRVGFAWDIFGDGKTAFRGGYGMYYGRINNGAIAAALFNTGSSSGQTTLTSATTGCKPTFPTVYSSACATASGARSAFYFDPNIQNPQIHQADLIFEREVARNTVLSINYLLSLGRQLPSFYDVNIKPSTSTVSYNFVGGPLDGQSMTLAKYTSRYSVVENPVLGKYSSVINEKSDVNSNYNALVVQLNRRMASGLQFLMNYTWSHALDNGQNSQTQSASYPYQFDPYNTALEYGTSNFDKRHRFVGSVVYQPNFFKNSDKTMHAILDGWSLAPIVTVSSGNVFTEATSGNISGGVTSNSGLNGSGGTFRLGTIYGRNSWSYPVFANVDMRVSRSFQVREGQKVEFIAEAFNLFNHLIPTGVNTTMYSLSGNTLTYRSDFGQVNQAGTNLYRERQVQFAARYSF